MSKKLIHRLTILFICVLGISAAVIYFTFDIRALEYLTMFKPWSILLALGSLGIGLAFDCLRLTTLTKITGEKLSFHEVMKVVLSNYFLALLTPGASGGAVAQIMFMSRAGVPIVKSTVVVFVRTIMSIFFLMMIVPFFMMTDPTVTEWIHEGVIVTVSILFTSIPFIAVVLMKTKYPKRLIYFFTKHVSHVTRKKCFGWYDDFKKAVFIMGENPWLFLKAFIESGLSLLFIYGTVPAFFLGLNINFDLVQVMGRMLFLNLVLYFSPTPGGSGIAEAGFSSGCFKGYNALSC